jgi:predicted RNA-binding Zn ribbon-like protein
MAEEKRINLKAQKFEKYTQDHQLNFFNKVDVKNDKGERDAAETTVFQSNIRVEGQTIPVGIITDNTIYTIIRVQVGSGLVKESNKNKFLEYLNTLNRSYKVFKYVAAEDGSVFLDACLPSTNDSFDPEVVKVVLDVIVDHLNHEYKNIMKEAWE